jgi:hypothetical protein
MSDFAIIFLIIEDRARQTRNEKLGTMIASFIGVKFAFNKSIYYQLIDLYGIINRRFIAPYIF